MPFLRGRAPYNQVLNTVSFWLMTGGMAFMTFVLSFVGTIQTHMQRVVGDYCMAVQDQLALFYMMRFGAGIAVVLGVILFIYSQFVVRREIIAPGPVAAGEVS
jgi:nitric oxide reductase subunit B